MEKKPVELLDEFVAQSLVVGRRVARELNKSYDMDMKVTADGNFGLFGNYYVSYLTFSQRRQGAAALLFDEPKKIFSVTLDSSDFDITEGRKPRQSAVNVLIGAKKLGGWLPSEFLGIESSANETLPDGLDAQIVALVKKMADEGRMPRMKKRKPMTLALVPA